MGLRSSCCPAAKRSRCKRPWSRWCLNSNGPSTADTLTGGTDMARLIALIVAAFMAIAPAIADGAGPDLRQRVHNTIVTPAEALSDGLGPEAAAASAIEPHDYCFFQTDRWCAASPYDMDIEWYPDGWGGKVK